MASSFTVAIASELQAAGHRPSAITSHPLASLVRQLALNYLTPPNSLLQRRVLLPGCVFPINLFGKSLSTHIHPVRAIIC